MKIIQHDLISKNADNIRLVLISEEIRELRLVVSSHCLFHQMEWVRFTMRGQGYESQAKDSLASSLKYQNFLDVLDELNSPGYKFNTVEIVPS